MKKKELLPFILYLVSLDATTLGIIISMVLCFDFLCIYSFMYMGHHKYSVPYEDKIVEESYLFI